MGIFWRCGRKAPNPIHNDLRLLFHTVRMERFAGLDRVAVGTRADPESAVEQVTHLRGRTTGKVAERSPRLILGAVGELMS